MTIRQGKNSGWLYVVNNEGIVVGMAGARSYPPPAQATVLFRLVSNFITQDPPPRNVWANYTERIGDTKILAAGSRRL